MSGTPHSQTTKPAAIYVWLVPSEQVLEQPGSWRIRKWDTDPFPEANFKCVAKRGETCPHGFKNADHCYHCSGAPQGPAAWSTITKPNPAEPASVPCVVEAQMPVVHCQTHGVHPSPTGKCLQCRVAELERRNLDLELKPWRQELIRISKSERPEITAEQARLAMQHIGELEQDLTHACALLREANPNRREWIERRDRFLEDMGEFKEPKA